MLEQDQDHGFQQHPGCPVIPQANLIKTRIKVGHKNVSQGCNKSRSLDSFFYKKKSHEFITELRFHNELVFIAIFII